MGKKNEDRCGHGTAATDPTTEPEWSVADTRGRTDAHEFGASLQSDGVTVESPGRLIHLMESATSAIDAKDEGRAYANGVAIGLIELITGFSLS